MAFVESRTGLSALLRAKLSYPIAGGARWAYTLGAALLFLLIQQAVTGILMATVYAPTVSGAWASVHYIQHELTLGWVVRGLHVYGTSGVVILLVLHLLQVVAYGAYKKPRELTWLSGLLLIPVLMGFATTGFLLPWDESGYWASRVEIGIIGGLPVVGEWLATLLQGGPSYGNFTLTRFYALHVIVLPLVAGGLGALHIYLFRRHGPAAAPGRPAAELEASESWWPGQAARDLGAMLLSSGLLLAMVVLLGPAPFDAPADPAADYIARPEWYFRFLFQLLRFLEGPAVILGTAVLPGVAAAGLAALPFLDRSDSRRLRDRRLVVLAFAIAGLSVAGLTIYSFQSDRGDEALAKQRERSEAEAKTAAEVASKYGVPPGDPQGIWRLDPDVHGARLAEEHCLTCHSLSGRGADTCPDLTGYGSVAWLKAFIKNPEDSRLLGRGGFENGMPPYDQLSDADLTALAHWVLSLGGEEAEGRFEFAKAERGAELIEAERVDCLDCHSADPDEDSVDGPKLAGYATQAWLEGLIRDPGGAHYFGDINEMTAFGEELDALEISHLATWVRGLWSLEGPLDAPPREDEKKDGSE